MSRSKKLQGKYMRMVIESYETQFKAAMRAKSLGLCKKVISHALYDHNKLREEYLNEIKNERED
jgi:hypothetical protein